MLLGTTRNWFFAACDDFMLLNSGVIGCRYAAMWGRIVSCGRFAIGLGPCIIDIA
jgi:hypothetical protein